MLLLLHGTMRLIVRGGWIVDANDVELLPRTRLLLLLPVVDATTVFHSPLPEETKDPSESNGFAETPTPMMPMPPFPVALPLLPPREEEDDEDGAAAGATANGSNGLWGSCMLHGQNNIFYFGARSEFCFPQFLNCPTVHSLNVLS